MVRGSMWSTLLLLTALTAGCVEANSELHLGAVSVGQQLVDLKAALDAGAITAEEYESAKDTMLRMAEELADSLDH